MILHRIVVEVHLLARVDECFLASDEILLRDAIDLIIFLDDHRSPHLVRRPLGVLTVIIRKIDLIW